MPLQGSASGGPVGVPSGLDAVNEFARWDDVADVLRAGRAAIFPTDTVYGLAVAPSFAPSPHMLYELKGRPSDKPVAWLVAGVDDLERYGADVPGWALQLARDYWPGALTLVVRASDQVPAAYRSAAGTIGLRMPAHEGVLQLIRAVGCPLATTSANLSGQPSPQRFADLAPELLARVPAACEPNPAPLAALGLASTVVDCTGTTPNILRAGAIAEIIGESLL